MYNPYNWKIVTDSERRYKELTELSLKLNYDLTVAEREVERIRNQLIEVDEAIENLVISDDISYDFLLSLIK